MKLAGKFVISNNMVTIRKATPADAALLAKMGAETFYDTFAADNTPEDMANYLAENFTSEKLAADLATPHIVYYIAESETEPVGYVKLETGATREEFPEQAALHIERIYVYRKFQQMKAGAALMQHCLELSAQTGCGYIWLGVWEKNTRAIQFYERWGFIPFGEMVFTLGTDRQTDILLYNPVSA